MDDEKLTAATILIEKNIIVSDFLERDVIVDTYLPKTTRHSENMSLLLINDGQDLLTMPFHEIFDELIINDEIEPLFCVGIHCGPNRKMEYGTARQKDFKGRGAKAGAYTQFVFKELLPFIR